MPRSSTTWQKNQSGNKSGLSAKDAEAREKWRKWAIKTCMRKRARLAEMADENPQVMLWLFEQAFGKAAPADASLIANEQTRAQAAEFAEKVRASLPANDRERWIDMLRGIAVGGRIASELLPNQIEESQESDSGGAGPSGSQAGGASSPASRLSSGGTDESRRGTPAADSGGVRGPAAEVGPRSRAEVGGSGGDGDD